MEEMNFEMAMRAILGDKRAYHSAGSAWIPKLSREWMLKCIVSLRKTTMKLDTTERHRSILLQRLERIEKNLRKINKEDDPRIYKATVWSLFYLAAALYGYMGFVTPSYWQTRGQNFAESGYDIEKHPALRKDIVQLQKEIIEKKMKEGVSKFDISLIMNTTEYKINKILRET